MERDRIVSPGPDERSVRTAQGEVLPVPQGWELLPPGDAGLTRRVKSGGVSWTVQEKRGRKVFGRGVWAPADRIEAARAALERERASEGYRKRRAGEIRRREAGQERYSREFERAVLAFLDFAPAHAGLAARLARTVAEHATPVGSGTVARTQRIPLAERAEAAVVAWLRHQTTGYDDMAIARVKGERRRVRRRLAERSRALLGAYREGGGPPAPGCPLARALETDSSKRPGPNDLDRGSIVAP